MNWIIRYSNKMEFHSHLNVVLKPIWDEVKQLNWLISDLEYHPDYTTDLPINHNQNYFILSPDEFKTLVNADPQSFGL